MQKKTKKRFVIWKWKKTWIFDSRDECKKLVQWFKNAKYKSFLSKDLAEKALSWKYEDFIWTDNRIIQSKFNWTNFFLKNKTDWKYSKNCIFVDASCLNNPWILEWRWVDYFWKEIFRKWPFVDWTINIWEFLALVEWLLYLKEHWQKNTTIYSDSITAISRVNKKKSNTKLIKTDKNKILFDLIKKAEKILNENIFLNPILKWNTSIWWEIPADFGRK